MNLSKFKTIFSAFILFSMNLMAKEGDKFNIVVSPLPLIIGSIQVGADIRVSDEFTVGPDLEYYSNNSTGVRSYGLLAGVRGNWYLTDKVFNSGWYVGPRIDYIFAKAKQDNAEASLSLWMLQAIGGYHWFFKSGLNLSLGIGGTYVSWPDYVYVNGKRISFDSYENMKLALEFNMGISF